MQIYINHPNNKKETMKKIFFRIRKGKKERKNCEIRKKTLILQPNSVKQTWRSHPSLTKQTMANRRKLKKTINIICEYANNLKYKIRVTEHRKKSINTPN